MSTFRVFKFFLKPRNLLFVTAVFGSFALIQKLEKDYLPIHRLKLQKRVREMTREVLYDLKERYDLDLTNVDQQLLQQDLQNYYHPNRLNTTPTQPPSKLVSSPH